ncbi:MAG: tryptophan synthase subunit alpha [Gemmatimonadetes bacterium]|nr:tryptophan synthase subunit alpha [Gemmatimonadota bacterium]
MSAITETFERLKADGQTGFIPFVTAGDPDLETTRELVVELANRGSDVIELGIPFSDPLADGPTNQASAQRALEAGTTLEGVFQCVEGIRKETDVPLIYMTYYNPVHQYGLEAFVKRCAAVGVNGALVTDLPPEEADNYCQLMVEAGLDTVFLLAPTSRDSRIRMVTDAATGFVYYVSRAGVTGEQQALADSLVSMVERIKGFTEKPLAVGFGISSPEQAAEVGEHADAVVVGSAIVRRIAEKGGDSDLVPQIGDFVASLMEPLKTKAVS